MLAKVFWAKLFWHTGTKHGEMLYTPLNSLIDG